MSASRKSSPASLAAADWLRWPATQEIFAALSAGGEEVRAVGGAVRDALLGRVVREVDFATTAQPEKVMELAAQAGLKAVPTGLDHGTVTVVAGGKGFEVTTLRKDVETYGRHAKVAYTGDWAADAARRDFTINALYAGADGTLHDPLGGLADVEARRVRFIGDARERVREDYLRILRFFRFNADLESSELDEAGLTACVRERGGLDGISGERVQGELLRLLAAPDARRALEAMFDHGLLVQVLANVPHLARFTRLATVEQGLEREPDPVLRLASLAIMVPEDVARLTERLRLSNAARKTLEDASDHRGLSAAMSDHDVRLALYRRGREAVGNAALTAWAESGAAARDPAWRKLMSKIADLPVPEFPLQGADIVALGMPEGPRVGGVLKAVETHWIAEGFNAGRDALLDLARRLAQSSEGSEKRND